jgi:hypothetical protein
MEAGFHPDRGGAARPSTRARQGPGPGVDSPALRMNPALGRGIGSGEYTWDDVAARKKRGGGRKKLVVGTGVMVGEGRIGWLVVASGSVARKSQGALARV